MGLGYLPFSDPVNRRIGLTAPSISIPGLTHLEVKASGGAAPHSVFHSAAIQLITPWSREHE
jgi:hypothetical protein